MNDRRLSSWKVVAQYLDQIWAEYQTNPAGLPIEFYEAFCAYYRPLAKAYLNEHRRIAEIAGFQRRVIPVINYMNEHLYILNLLDAGCGMGTFAIFFALLGIHVLGVDLNKTRIAIAERRLVYYRQKGLNGAARFVLANVLKFLETAGNEIFDIIWVNEAISHIDPVTDFLSLAIQALKPGGIIVISDQNAWNPLVQVKLFQKRGLNYYTNKPDPQTGILINYALERIFSAQSLARLLRNTGFTSVEAIFHSFVPLILRATFLYPSLLMRLEEKARRVPGIKYFAGSYTLIGRR